MRSSTTIQSWSAILVGLLFSLVTSYVLLEDVARHGAPVTTKHVMTLAVLAGTIYFGHRFWSQLRGAHLGTALGCMVLFTAGTCTCVVMSAGRNAEVVTTKVATANAVNHGRISAQKDRDEAKARYESALAAETAECASGNGAKCSAKRITRMVRREEYDAAEAKLRAEKPEQIANADIRAAAELLARLPYVTASVATIEASLQLLQPFLLSLFCEVAAIVAFSMGLGHRLVLTVLPQLPAPVASVASPVIELPAEKTAPATVAQPSEAYIRAKRAKPTDAQIVLEALEQAGRPLSNDELAAATGVTKGEMSKRVANCGELVRIRRNGRYYAITPNYAMV